MDPVHRKQHEQKNIFSGNRKFENCQKEKNMNPLIIIVALIIAASSINIDIGITIHFNIASEIIGILVILYTILIETKND